MLTTWCTILHFTHHSALSHTSLTTDAHFTHHMVDYHTFHSDNQLTNYNMSMTCENRYKSLLFLTWDSECWSVDSESNC